MYLNSRGGEKVCTVYVRKKWEQLSPDMTQGIESLLHKVDKKARFDSTANKKLSL